MVRRFLFALLGCSLLVASALAADFESLARRLPENCNAVGLINMKALLDSPMGLAQRWAGRSAELTNIPPTVNEMAIGGVFNPAAGLHDWRFGVARMTRAFSMDEVAKKFGGTVSTVAGQKAVFTPTNMAIVDLGGNLLGLHTASNRQELARWLRMNESAQTLVLPAYLRDFVKDTSAAQVRMALYTDNLFDPEGVKRALGNIKALGGNADRIAQVAGQIAMMKGMSFSIRVDNEIRGTLKIDFAGDVSNLSDIADAVIREALQEQGLYLPDFDGFKTQVRGSSVFFEGTMTEAGLRQAMTLLNATQPSVHSVVDSPGEQSMDSPAAVSKRYFNGVTGLIDDLRRQMRRLQNSREFAHWYEHTARRIDQLPVVGVDDELVNFGGTTADKLRALAQSVRGVQIDVNKLNTYRRSSTTVSAAGGVGTAWGYGFGYATGGAYFNNNYADVNQMQAEVRATGARDRVDVWNQIDASLGQIRRDMSRKFNVDF